MERKTVVGFPNELANDDPGSFHQAELIRFLPPEPDGTGVYNQMNFLINLYDHLENIENKWHQLQAQRTMRRALESECGIPCLQKKFKKHSQISWDDGLPVEWWREIPSLTIYDIARDDDLAAKELANGHWD